MGGRGVILIPHRTPDVEENIAETEALHARAWIIRLSRGGGRDDEGGQHLTSRCRPPPRRRGLRRRGQPAARRRHDPTNHQRRGSHDRGPATPVRSRTPQLWEAVEHPVVSPLAPANKRWQPYPKGGG